MHCYLSITLYEDSKDTYKIDLLTKKKEDTRVNDEKKRKGGLMRGKKRRAVANLEVDSTAGQNKIKVAKTWRKRKFFCFYYIQIRFFNFFITISLIYSRSLV